jgi:hypothetical protein
MRSRELTKEEVEDQIEVLVLILKRVVFEEEI